MAISDAKFVILVIKLNHLKLNPTIATIKYLPEYGSN